MNKIYLALGSNVGNRGLYIKKAISSLGEQIFNIEQAQIYISKATGYENQNDFYNTVISGMTDLTCMKLLKFIKEIEKYIGRKKRFHWGPREIDIDILFFNDIIMETDELIIPHPRIIERDFVLLPILDLDPEFYHKGEGMAIKNILHQLPTEKLSIKQVLG